MPDPEFEKLLSLCYEWSNHDAEYIYDSTLREDAPDYVKIAFEKLKKIVDSLEGVNEKGEPYIICI